MTLQDTLAALKELAETPENNAGDMLDDMLMVEELIMGCDVPLSLAARRHLVEQFYRRRAAVMA